MFVTLKVADVDLTVELEVDLTVEEVYELDVDLPVEDTNPNKYEFAIGETVTANEGTGSASKQWKGVVVEIDPHCGIYIILCSKVPHYPHGYNMVVPFSEVKTRINQPIHTGKRKRKRKVIESM